MIRSSIAHARPTQPRRAVALLALGTVLLAACGGTAGVSPSAQPASPAPGSSGPSASPGQPTPTPGSSSSGGACASSDIHATSGPWLGAAGSRGADIVVENQGATSCRLPAEPTVQLVDRAGTVLLASRPALAGGGPTIGPSGTVSFSLLFSNWCNRSVSLPLHVRLVLASGAIDIGGLSISTVDELPPCNGPGQPASLSTTAWQPR